jgi:hypothetical protein
MLGYGQAQMPQHGPTATASECVQARDQRLAWSKMPTAAWVRCCSSVQKLKSMAQV